MQANPTALPHLHDRWVFTASHLLSDRLDPLIDRDAMIYLRSADAYLRDRVAVVQSLDQPRNKPRHHRQFE